MKRNTLTYLALFCLLLVAPLSSASAKDNWMSVRSKNFFLVGNANEKEIRRVAVRLEQFRDVLSRLLKANLTSSTPTTVVVFKSRDVYKQFAPPNSAGYYISGPDMNYIALSAEQNTDDPHPFSTIFHEYVHFLVRNNLQEVPIWFNEGLAEYYSVLEVGDDDRKVQIGLPIGEHLYALRENKMLPLQTLFAVDHSSPYYNEKNKRGVFYAQSWAVVHYLLLGNEGKRQPQFSTFINLLLNNKSVEEAFQQAFQMDFVTLEKELKEYVKRRSYPGQVATFERKLEIDAEMQSAALTEAEGQFYLGDLLLHAHQLERAEKFLQQAVKLDPNLSIAEASLGMLYMWKNNFAEAKRHLERAVAGNTSNYLVHYYYAMMLSREGMDASGMISSYPSELLEKMRAELKKTIELAPTFAEGYRLLAFINLVAGDKTDEALALLKRAVALEPGELQHRYMLAQVYMQKRDYTAARALLESVVRGGDPDTRSQAQQMLDSVKALEAQAARWKAEDERRASASAGETPTTDGGPPKLTKREESSSMPETKVGAETNGPHVGLRQPRPGEEQVRGTLVNIDCSGTNIVLTIRVGERLLKLESEGLEDIEFTTYSPDINGDVTCGTRKPENPVIVIYRPSKNARTKLDGQVLAVSFVTKEMLENK
ncbi:MAG TPA: FimV/HubP family polar landmark protein [Pyrinomonadaceae bacterium]|jgi:FimV-like protein